MNKYELICQYCAYSWQIIYLPEEKVYCLKCRDSNIQIIKLSDRIDYYQGCPPFDPEAVNWNF